MSSKLFIKEGSRTTVSSKLVIKEGKEDKGVRKGTEVRKVRKVRG